MTTHRLRLAMAVMTPVLSLSLLACGGCGRSDEDTRAPKEDTGCTAGDTGTQDMDAVSLDPAKTHRFAYQSWMVSGEKLSFEKGRLTVTRLKALGYQIPTTEENPFGPLRDVQIAENVTVTGVPWVFIETCLDRTRIHVKNACFNDEQQRTLDFTNPKVVSRGFAAMLYSSTYAGLAEALSTVTGGERDLAPEEIVVAEASAAATRGEPRRGYTPLAAQWVMSPDFADYRAKRRERSFRDLLESLDPQVPITRGNADAVAEELVWTKSLGISDGTFESLANSRRILQALLLEELGYQVGDPTDPDIEKREEALKKLEETTKLFQRLWREAYDKATAADGK